MSRDVRKRLLHFLIVLIGVSLLSFLLVAVSGIDPAEQLARRSNVNATPDNNISMGRPDATYEEVIAAAKKARCYDFITALSDGFATVVGEGGESLSGGEKQRISIARCILKDAPVVILDEATASVDADNETCIQQAISELCQGKTLLVIAHRLGTIRSADQILVVSGGEIAQKGSHEELMEQDGIYKNFVMVRQNSLGWSRSRA